MASYKKTSTGWRADIFKRGVRKSKTLPRKADVQRWAKRLEKEIEEHYLNPHAAPADASLSDLLKRYQEEICPNKKGERWEIIRINAFLRDKKLTGVKLTDLGPRHFAQWRDRRLQEVSGSTVNREFNLIRHVVRIAENEWQWLDKNPMKGVRRPKENRPRNRVITPDEIDRFVTESGYSSEGPPTTIQSRVGAMLLFASETAMRSGEISAMKASDIDYEARVVYIPETKTDMPRWVPLSKTAMAVVENVLKVNKGKPTVFEVTPRQKDATTRKLFKRAGLLNITFHDTRRTALTRLAKKFGAMDLAKISGHTDLKMLQRVYYAPDARDFVAVLDS